MVYQCGPLHGALRAHTKDDAVLPVSEMLWFDMIVRLVDGMVATVMREVIVIHGGANGNGMEGLGLVVAFELVWEGCVVVGEGTAHGAGKVVPMDNDLGDDLEMTWKWLGA